MSCEPYKPRAQLIRRDRFGWTGELSETHGMHVEAELPYGILGAEGVAIDELSMGMLRQLG
mgnify:FL=1